MFILHQVGLMSTLKMKSNPRYLSHPILRFESDGQMLFMENQSNFDKLWGGLYESPYVKNAAFHEGVVDPCVDAVNQEALCGKGGAWFNLWDVPSGQSAVVRFKVTNKIRNDRDFDETDFDDVVTKRRTEGNAFYWTLANLPISDDMKIKERESW